MRAFKKQAEDFFFSFWSVLILFNCGGGIEITRRGYFCLHGFDLLVSLVLSSLKVWIYLLLLAGLDKPLPLVQLSNVLVYFYFCFSRDSLQFPFAVKCHIIIYIAICLYYTQSLNRIQTNLSKNFFFHVKDLSFT